MGFFDFLKPEEPKEDIHEYRGASLNISSLLNGTTSMTIEQVEKIPAVNACANLITNTIASLPIYLYKEDKEGNIERVYGDYREFLLNSEPNMTMNAFNMKKQLSKDFLFYGASYIKTEWGEDNKLQELWNFEADKVSVLKYQKEYKTTIRFKYVNNGEFEFEADEIAQILKDSADGAKTKGLLHTGVDVFQIALKEMKFTENIYNNGALPLGVLKSANRLSPDVLERLGKSWKNMYSKGSETAGSTVILEEGMTYETVSLSPDKLKLVESKNHTTSDICRLFNVPESMINSSANKYGSLEQDNIRFLQMCLVPILTSIESAFDRAMLLEEEKREGYFYAFDTSEIQRGTEKERYEALNVALNAGILSVNEARTKMNLKPIKDDVLKWSLGSVLYYLDEEDKNKRLYIPNMAQAGNTTGEVPITPPEPTENKENVEEDKEEN